MTVSSTSSSSFSPIPGARVIVGMSGGVDSSVAAFLLQQQGYRVEGLFMKNWEGDDLDPTCSAETDIADAKAVCAKLNIPFHFVNFSRTYWDNVFRYFLDEYQAGRTPNPDILCNKEIKFKAFLDHALELGADYIATGHYVGKRFHDAHWQLLTAADNTKDQSYFLYTLGQKALEKSLFPLATLAKADVRRIAEQARFINHAKKDSTGICFIGERHFKSFLQSYVLTKPGVIKEYDTKRVLGQHDGLMFYTLGQRRGLHIGGVSQAQEMPWYVVEKEIETNTLWVAQGHDHPALLSSKLHYQQAHWIAETAPEFPLRCTAKTRYRHPAQPCTVYSDHVIFDQPEWAVTPGQSIVFYSGNVCLGGGVIASRTPLLSAC